MFTNVLKDMIKHTDEQPDEEVHCQGKVRKGSEHRSFCPHGAGRPHSPSKWMCSTHLETPQTPHYWDFMDVSSHCVCVCVCTQSCLILCNPLDYSPSGSYVHAILQARILEQVAISFSRGSPWPRDWTCISGISFIGRQILHHLGNLKVSNSDLPKQFFSNMRGWVSVTYTWSGSGLNCSFTLIHFTTTFKCFEGKIGLSLHQGLGSEHCQDSWDLPILQNQVRRFQTCGKSLFALLPNC